MPNTKPYVQAALICEKVLPEADGVHSVIRIIDKISADVPTSFPAQMTPAVDFMIFVAIKSGDLRGKSQMSIRIRTPSGKQPAMQPGPWTILLNGSEHGAALILRVSLPFSDFGLYWFDVYWERELLTSIPLKLERTQHSLALGPGTKPQTGAGTP